MDHAALAQANAALNTVHEIATLLDTGLDKDEVAILIALVENGVNPEVRLGQNCSCLYMLLVHSIPLSRIILYRRSPRL